MLAFHKIRLDLLVLYLIPLIILLWFVATFSIDEPFWDQLEFPFIFQKVAAGHANFADFFAQHNEHRIFFPRLILTTLAFASQWNISYELYLNIFLAIITFLALAKISASQVKIVGTDTTHLANILMGILLFSLVQWENWLWGFQVVWFLINACVAVAILIFYSFKQWLPIQKLFLAALFCFIASFSSAHGLLSWLAMLPSVAALPGNLEQKIKTILIWIFLSVISIGIYFRDYQKPDIQPDSFFFIKNPSIAFEYFLSLLGSPLVAGINPFAFQDASNFSVFYIESARNFDPLFAQIIGFILLIAFLIIALYISVNCQKNKIFISELIPWFSLGLFSYLFAVINTIGRAETGVVSALQSRYTTASVLLIISLLQIWKLCCKGFFPYKKLWAQQGYKVLGIILLSLIVSTSINSVNNAKEWHLQRENGKICMQLMRFIDEQSPDSCFSLIYPNIKDVKSRLKILSRIGFRQFPKNISFITQPTQDYGRIDTPPTMKTSLRLRQRESVEAAGWAIFPDQLKQPKMVLFSYGDEKKFFTSAPVRLASPDVANFLNSNRYNQVRWSIKFSANSLSLGETAIKAWVYDAASQKFFKLVGEPRVVITK